MAAVVGDCIGALYETSGVVTMEEVLGVVKKREQSKTSSSSSSSRSDS